MSFSFASEVKEIATRYIDQHHQHLANVRIEYLFTSKTMKKGGRLLAYVQSIQSEIWQW